MSEFIANSRKEIIHIAQILIKETDHLFDHTERYNYVLNRLWYNGKQELSKRVQSLYGTTPTGRDTIVTFEMAFNYLIDEAILQENKNSEPVVKVEIPIVVNEQESETEEYPTMNEADVNAIFTSSEMQYVEDDPVSNPVSEKELEPVSKKTQLEMVDLYARRRKAIDAMLQSIKEYKAAHRERIKSMTNDINNAKEAHKQSLEYLNKELTQARIYPTHLWPDDDNIVRVLRENNLL